MLNVINKLAERGAQNHHLIRGPCRLTHEYRYTYIQAASSIPLSIDTHSIIDYAIQQRRS